MKDTKKYLNVLNASAGSGKTYSLVETYVLLLLDDTDSDSKYAEILAMTFTNKAALEMKTRIIKALDELAYNNIHKTSYLEKISKKTGLKEEWVEAKSRRLLSGILHHYEDFNVLTIDKFNLRLIRSFSRDLNLPPDFEVVINEVPILEQVVDELLQEIGLKKELSELILGYAKSNIEQETSWNLRTSLIEFGKVLLSERDLPYVNRLMQTTFSKQDYKQLNQRLKELNQEYQQLSEEVIRVYFDLGLSSETIKIKHKNHVNTGIQKAKNSSFSSGFPFSDNSIKNIQDASENADVHEFYSKVIQLKTFYETHLDEAASLEVYLKNYFNMALLRYINGALLNLNKQERLIRISEFNTMISELLREDTLYIYEKLGTRFRHFMLDEFQDTSRLQWMNLVPLIRESLGHGNINFIVGDPKQAIYRFKNGVAEQFVELPGIYNPEKDREIALISDYFRKMGGGEAENLEDNWRSAPEIVQFNNALFNHLKGNLDGEGIRFYNSIHQNPQSSEDGFIYVESTLKKKEEESKDFEFVHTSIKDAISDGYKPGDICILGSKNEFCNTIANQLTNEGFSVVSADSLNIDSELTVRFIISYFKLRLNPTNQNSIKQFLHSYCSLFGYSLEYYNTLFEVKKGKNEKEYKIANLNLFFKKNSWLEETFFDPFETLYDLTQKTYRLFKLNELKNTYIHHFSDLVHLYESKNGPDLNEFLVNYETISKDSKALQIPESENALKVMTIHKSKGLEFPVVIVVNQTKSNESVNGDFFIESDDFLLRSRLSKNAQLEKVKEAHEKELQKEFLDALNLYYVAYTRPVNRLYIKNEYESKGLGANIHSALKTMSENSELDQDILFRVGKKTKKDYTSKPTLESYFSPQSSKENLWFPDIALQDSEELNSTDFLSEEQRYGNQFHLAVSSIHQKEEIDSVLQKLIFSGQVEKLFFEQLKSDLQQLFLTPTYTNLFDEAKRFLVNRIISFLKMNKFVLIK